MSEHRASSLGSEAALLLDNPAFNEAMKRLRDDVSAQWMNAPVRDLEGQRLLLITAKIVEKFDATLRGLIQSGNLAQSKIEVNDMRDESNVRRMARHFVS